MTFHEEHAFKYVSLLCGVVLMDWWWWGRVSLL